MSHQMTEFLRIQLLREWSSSIAPSSEDGQPPMRFVLLLLLLVARDAIGETIVLRGAAQGTTYHIKFVAPANGVDAQRLQADVERVLADVDRQMSTYRADSEISQFNRAPAGKWFPVSAATASVVAAAQEISKQSGGAMDVTVGPLVRLWHFGPPDGTGKRSSQDLQPPSAEQLQAVRKRVGYQQLDVQMTPPALRKHIDGLEIDLSSIASGYTIDRLAELLLQHGMKNFMVELGGEVRAAGRRTDGKPWRVAIERPLAPKREMEAAVSLSDTALATAGGSRKLFEHEGRRYSHIIDPATGRPVEHALASVTVAADKCTDADGWDTPLLVLGPEKGFECAEQHAIAALFISHTDAGDVVRTTTAWRKRFGASGN